MAEENQIYLGKKNTWKSPPASAPLILKSSLPSESDADKVHFINRQISTQQEASRYNSCLPKSCRNFYCLCLVWKFCLLLLFIVVIVIAALILYAVFQPQLPKYSVHNVRIINFSVGLDSTFSSQINVREIATNLNKMIGIDYLEHSHIGVFYGGREMCRGKLPAFYQGYKNTCYLDIILTGTNVKISSEMFASLIEKKKGSIPLHLKADVPVKIKFGKLKTTKITFHVRCEFLADNLDDNMSSINIRTKQCKVKL